MNTLLESKEPEKSKITKAWDGRNSLREAGESGSSDVW